MNKGKLIGDEVVGARILMGLKSRKVSGANSASNDGSSGSTSSASSSGSASNASSSGSASNASSSGSASGAGSKRPRQPGEKLPNTKRPATANSTYEQILSSEEVKELARVTDNFHKVSSQQLGNGGTSVTIYNGELFVAAREYFSKLTSTHYKISEKFRSEDSIICKHAADFFISELLTRAMLDISVYDENKSWAFMSSSLSNESKYVSYLQFIVDVACIRCSDGHKLLKRLIFASDPYGQFTHKHYLIRNQLTQEDAKDLQELEYRIHIAANEIDKERSQIDTQERACKELKITNRWMRSYDEENQIKEGCGEPCYVRNLSYVTKRFREALKADIQLFEGSVPSREARNVSKKQLFGSFMSVIQALDHIHKTYRYRTDKFQFTPNILIPMFLRRFILDIGFCDKDRPYCLIAEVDESNESGGQYCTFSLCPTDYLNKIYSFSSYKHQFKEIKKNIQTITDFTAELHAQLGSNPAIRKEVKRSIFMLREFCMYFPSPQEGKNIPKILSYRANFRLSKSDLNEIYREARSKIEIYEAWIKMGSACENKKLQTASGSGHVFPGSLMPRSQVRTSDHSSGGSGSSSCPARSSSPTTMRG